MERPEDTASIRAAQARAEYDALNAGDAVLVPSAEPSLNQPRQGGTPQTPASA